MSDLLGLIGLLNVESLSLLDAFDNIVKRRVRVNLQPGGPRFGVVLFVQMLQSGPICIVKVDVHSSFFNFFLRVFIRQGPAFDVFVFVSEFLLEVLADECKDFLTAFGVFETEIVHVVGLFVDTLFGLGFDFIFIK